jgi:hypothetical protein
MTVWVVRCADSDLTHTDPVLFQSEKSARKYWNDDLRRLWQKSVEKEGRDYAGTLADFKKDWELNYTCHEQEVNP